MYCLRVVVPLVSCVGVKVACVVVWLVGAGVKIITRLLLVGSSVVVGWL